MNQKNQKEMTMTKLNTKNIVDALAKFQEEANVAKRTKKNTFFKSSYATLEDVIAAANEGAKFGLAFTQTIDYQKQIIEGVKKWGQGLKSKGVFSDEDFEEFKVFAATANGINTINKLRKYYGEQTIPTAPVDVDGMPSNDELYDLVADPKYKTDPAFRRKVEQQFARAFPGKVDTGEI